MSKISILYRSIDGQIWKTFLFSLLLWLLSNLCYGYDHRPEQQTNFDDNWMHHIVLDAESKFHLKWSFDLENDWIIFNACVETLGWFSIGLSQSGSMTGSDMVLLWVDSKDNNKNHGYIQDRFAEDEELPKIDQKQDWNLLKSMENDTHTCMIFNRVLLTCDYDYDLPITNDIIKLIWAYHHDDPIIISKSSSSSSSSSSIGEEIEENKYGQSNDNVIILKHDHNKRGHKSVHLLNHNFDFENNNNNNDNVKDDDDETMIKYWDITSNNFTIPNSDTTYWCKIVSPSFKSRAHVIKIEPIISPKINLPFVHHMVLYRCLHPKPELLKDYLDQPGINCLDFQNMPFDFFHCQSIYMVWATGGESFTMPSNVGVPIFEDHETTYFMFEIHYDNPELKSNIHDSSGLRLYYTNNLRPYQADTATMGSVVDYRLIIPNGYENFTVSGHCSPECFQNKMPKDGINVLAALPHGHKHLERIVVRHFRGQEELEPLAEENNYDFNFQDFRRFEKERKILPGDQITVECTYNTDSLVKPLFGGLSTQEEMCMVFLIYYPRMKGVRTCLSGLTPETVMKLSNVKSVDRLDENDMNPLIIEPLEYANISLSSYVLDKTDWSFNSPSTSSSSSSSSSSSPAGGITETDLIQLLRYEPQKAQCYWRKIEGIDGLESMDEINELISYPKPLLRPYQKPKKKCQTKIPPLSSSTTTITSTKTKTITRQHLIVDNHHRNNLPLSVLSSSSTSSSSSSSSKSNQNFLNYYHYLILLFVIFL